MAFDITISLKCGGCDRVWPLPKPVTAERLDEVAREMKDHECQRDGFPPNPDPYARTKEIAQPDLDFFRGSLRKCPLHGKALGPPPERNCPDCRAEIENTLMEEADGCPND